MNFSFIFVVKAFFVIEGLFRNICRKWYLHQIKMHWVVKQKKKNWNLFIGQNNDWSNLLSEWTELLFKINHYVMLSHKHVLTRKLLRKQSCHRNQENRESRGWLSYQLEVRFLPSFKLAQKNCALSFFKGKFETFV